MLVSMGGQAEGLACADPGARTPIGASGNFNKIIMMVLYEQVLYEQVLRNVRNVTKTELENIILD